MRRYSNLFQQIRSLENLEQAHKSARKGKTHYREVKMVDQDSEKYLKEIQAMLDTKSFKTSEYVISERTEGKKTRIIYKLPYYPDRIVQWAILKVVEPILIRSMTKDTYSAIPKRGTHLALSRLRKEWRKNPEECRYCLKLDMQKYYQSIPHEKLKETYRRLFKDKDLLALIDEIIDSTAGDIGIPIGNYLSQYSGNLYLSKLDHWLKEEKHIKHYFRYMDDIVILHGSKEFLHSLYQEINAFALDELGLTIKPNYQVFPSDVRGIDFLGFRIFKDYVLLRKSVAKNLKHKMLAINKKLARGGNINYNDYCSFNSYKGWLKYCDSYRLYLKYMASLEDPMHEYYLNHVKGGRNNGKKC